MNPEQTRASLLAFLRERSPGKDITTDTPLLESGVLDSFGIVQLIAYLESSLHAEFRDEEINADNFATVSSIVKLLSRLKP